MIIDKVTSRQNPLIKRFRTVRQRRERHLIFIEGVRLIEEALKSQLHLETVAYTEQLHSTERGSRLYESLKKLPCRGALVTDAIMAAISEVESPQGVAAITHLPYTALEDAIKGGTTMIVIAHQLQDPGNLGSIIRTAEGVGAASLIATAGTVDPFNLKSLRAAMGSAFRLPLVANAKLQSVAELCRKAQLQLVAAEVGAKRNYADFNWNEPVALLLGQEASGLDKAAAKIVEERISIPMAKNVESLNVATAAAVVLYEAARQRGFKF